MSRCGSDRRLRLHLVFECRSGGSRYRLFGVMYEGRQVLFVGASDWSSNPFATFWVWKHCRDGCVLHYCQRCGRASEPSCGCDQLE